MDQTEIGLERPIFDEFQINARKLSLNLIGCSAKNRFAAQRSQMRRITPLPELRRKLRLESKHKIAGRFQQRGNAGKERAEIGDVFDRATGLDDVERRE
jgi:hypothetical protein